MTIAVDKKTGRDILVSLSALYFGVVDTIAVDLAENRRQVTISLIAGKRSLKIHSSRLYLRDEKRLRLEISKTLLDELIYMVAHYCYLGWLEADHYDYDLSDADPLRTNRLTLQIPKPDSRMKRITPEEFLRRHSNPDK